MDQNLADAKKELRAIVKSRLKTLQYDRVATARELYDNLVSLPHVRQAKTLGVFVDFGTEPPVRYCIPRLFDADSFTRVLCVPFCVGPDLAFYKLERPDVDPTTNAPIFHDLVPMTFGILEPSPARRSQSQNIVAPEELDVMITPGLAFDLQGRRLGRGAGYYDRYLPKLRQDALVVGIGYEEQLVQEAPADERDVRIHALVTPDRVVVFK